MKTYVNLADSMLISLNELHACKESRKDKKTATDLISCVTLTARVSTLVDRIWRYRRQILSTKIDPRAVRVNIFLVAVDP